MAYIKPSTNEQKECEHCWHAHEKASWIVLPNGHILQNCCKCHRQRHVHREHAREISHVA